MSISGWIAPALAIVSTVVTSTLVAFLNTKARNLASKEDLRDLTESVEEVKAHYRVQEEHLRATLQRRAASAKAQYEVELPIYRDLWLRVIDLERLLNEVQVQAVSQARGGTQAHTHAFMSFQEGRAALDAEQLRLDPFVDPQVRLALMAAVLRFRSVAVDSLAASAMSDEQKATKLRAWVASVVQGREELSAAIRLRLFSDVAPVASAVGEPLAISTEGT
jgi:hypothetical protein